MGVALRTAAQLRSQRESSNKAASDSKISLNSWSPGAHYDILEDAFPACGVFHVVMQGSALCAGTVVDGTRLALSAFPLPSSRTLGVCARMLPVETQLFCVTTRFQSSLDPLLSSFDPSNVTRRGWRPTLSDHREPHSRKEKKEK